MRSDSWRRAHAQFALGLVLLVPLAADAADREFLRLAQAQERDTRFEDCALVCQKQIDRRIAYCTGLKEALNPADVRQRVQQVRDVLDDGTGNPYAGEATFMTRCAACHKLFHKGGKVGPDLTPYQRAVVTVEGRILSGFLVDQDNQIITLRVKAGEDVRIERKDVDEIAPVGRSLMPDGVLDGLSDQQLRDFFAYLRISQPITQ